MNLLRVSAQVAVCDEPGIGYHLALFSADVMGPHPPALDASGSLLPAARRSDSNYFFAEAYQESWRPNLRSLVLDRFAMHLRDAGRESSILVIKEPAGSQAAGTIFDLLPSSRLIFLQRDGRDVLDSELDAINAGGWLAELFGADEELSTSQRMDFLRGQAHRWVARTQVVQRAFDALPDSRRLLIRYEDARADTVGVLERTLDWLGVQVPDGAITDFVERLSFERAPAPEKGRGKFARSATPGGWRKNLTIAEQETVNSIMRGSLEQYGYEVE